MAKFPSAPGEGERRAQRGYTSQYAQAAAAIHQALVGGDLEWVGLAHRGAGIADDLVLGFPGRVVGHQFKMSQFPETFALTPLFFGADALVKPLVDAWERLRALAPGARVEIQFVTNDIPSTRDAIAAGPAGHSAGFVRELELDPQRPLADWRSTRWAELVGRLATASGLREEDFGAFLTALRIVSGQSASYMLTNRLSAVETGRVQAIASLLPRLVADRRDRDRWTREELLRELGWRDIFYLHRLHRFPIGTYVQRNRSTERELKEALLRSIDGYVALTGPPGSGKSTLLQLAVVAAPDLAVVRYLAYVPGEAQGLGRGEAADFLDDVNSQLGRSLGQAAIGDSSLQDKRRLFQTLVLSAGERFVKGGRPHCPGPRRAGSHSQGRETGPQSTIRAADTDVASTGLRHSARHAATRPRRPCALGGGTSVIVGPRRCDRALVARSGGPDRRRSWAGSRNTAPKAV